MSNVGALDQVRTFLRAHPKLHVQSSWVCGTTACIAGWAVALDEGKKAWDWLPADGEPYSSFIEGRIVERDARILLGLTVDEADALFLESGDEVGALALVDALVARDKGELTDDDRAVLADHGLPQEMAGDAA
jgi:hypothetical protein